MQHHVIATLLRAGRRDLAVAYAQYVVAKRELFYHGTSSVFAKRILSEGFVPDPKKRIWDPETGAQESFTGTYFSAQPTVAGRYASGAVRKFGGFAVIFEVQLETRTGVFDEDEIQPLPSAVLFGLMEYNKVKNIGSLVQNTAQWLLDNEQHLKGLIAASRPFWFGKGTEDYRAATFWQLWRTRYGQAEPDPRYMAAVNKRYDDAARAFIQDVANGTPANKRGPVFNAAYTRLFKTINLSKFGPQQRGGPGNIRISEPVTFKGANKILAAIGEKFEMIGGERRRTVNILYGNPSQTLLKPYHDEEVVVKQGWPKAKKMAASTDYMMGHRPTKTAPLHDLTQGVR